jgi:hypothetical protein
MTLCSCPGFAQENAAPAVPQTTHSLKFVHPGIATTLVVTEQANLDCTTDGPAEISVVSPPKFGVINIVRQSRYPNFPASNPRRKCNDIELPASVAYYMTKEPGFTRDNVIIREAFSNGQIVNLDLDLVLDPKIDLELERLRSNSTADYERPSIESENISDSAATHGVSPATILTAYSMSRDCRSIDYPLAAVTEAPKYGRVEISTRYAYIYFAEGHPFYHCNGKIARQTRLVYQANPDFIGTDYVRITGKFPSGRVFSKTVTIKVDK